MLGVQFTMTNKSGTSFDINDLSTVPDVITLQEYPVFRRTLRSNIIDRDGQHGATKLPSYWGRWNITFVGTIVGTDEATVVQQKDLMLEVLGIPAQPTLEDQGEVELTFTDPRGRDLKMNVFLAQEIQFGREIRKRCQLDYQIQLVSVDTAFTGGGTPELNSGVRGWEQGGIGLPMQSLLSTGFKTGLNYNQVLTVTNTGNTNAPLLVRMYGSTRYPIVNPKITNLSTGDSMKILTTLFNENEYVEIDAVNSTITNHNNDDISGLLANDGSVFVNLIVGDNELLYTSSENEDELDSVLFSRTLPNEVLETEHNDAVI